MRFIPAVLLLSLGACRTGPGLPSYGIVQDFTLTDQQAREFRSKDRLDGRVWIANFIFTTCMGPCPRMTAQMRQVRDATAAAANLRYVSFTIDPDRDTPEALATYSAHFKPDPERWFLLTGPRAVLHRLKHDDFKLGSVDSTLEHSTRFVLVDAQSRVRGFYDSSDPEAMKKLAADAQELARG